MRSSENWLKRIRNLAGFLGMILPWTCLWGAANFAKTFGVPDDFWYTLSISRTYFVTPAMSGILTTVAIVLMCYDGYDWRDITVNTIAGVFAILTVMFPCKSPLGNEPGGFFLLPENISQILHSIFSVALFVTLAFNSMFLFTLGESNTKQKKIRNIIYKICGVGMILSLIITIIPLKFFAKIFIGEALALTFFGISWLIKGQIFGILSDK